MAANRPTVTRRMRDVNEDSTSTMKNSRPFENEILLNAGRDGERRHLENSNRSRKTFKNLKISSNYYY